MGAARKLAHYVTLSDSEGETHTFGPDDTVPAWAAKAITNPSAWAEGDRDARSADETSTEDEPPSYKGWLKADLEDEVARRNGGRAEDDVIEVEGNGTVADLVAALEADDNSK